jgi:hypothetical protein
MGILTKHLLEPVVPPRKRRPDLDIMPDVEAICLKAMEKDRDKRFPDMDAFYRALGAAGGLPFEPSQVFVPPRAPKASLKYPTLAQANPEARESRTAIASSGTFEDERPVRLDEAAAGSRKPLMIALVVGGLALAAVGAVLALRPSSKPATPEPAVANKPAPTAPAAVAPPAPPPPPIPAPAEPAAAKPAAAEAPASTESAKPSRRRHRSTDGDEVKADPLHRAIPVPAEPTPAELKNPFGNP